MWQVGSNTHHCDDKQQQKIFGLNGGFNSLESVDRLINTK
jgi:hypothetical protein